MSKKLLFAALGLSLFIVAAMTYILLQKGAKPERDKTGIEGVEVQTRPQPDGINGVAKGTYVNYTEDSFMSAQGTKLLFFHAPWCPQCRALDESIKVSELPDDLIIFKVDYDSNQSLRAKYGVTLQTTVVKTDEKGNKLDVYVAYDKPTFQSVKQALLP